MDERIPLNEFLKRIGKIQDEVETSSTLPDSLTKKEIEAQIRETELASFRQDIVERKKYAKLTFNLICWWLIGIFFLISAQGFCSSIFGRTFLSDKILITIIGGTTINVLGLFVIVVRYLFKQRK